MNNLLKNKLTGWVRSKIVSFNPTEEELLELTGEAELEKELNYTFQNKAGNDCCILDFYISDINDENIFKYTIYLENKEKSSKNGSNLYVNQLGDSQWSSTENSLWDDFTGFIDKKWNNTTNKYDVLGKLADKKYHVSLIGEYEILSLLKTTGRYNLKDPDTSLFIDMEKLFSGDFSELKDEIPIGTPVFNSFVYINAEFEQKVFSQFMGLQLFLQCCNNTPDKYSKGLFNNFYKAFEFIADDVYYNFGKLQPFQESFLKNVKELNNFDAEY